MGDDFTAWNKFKQEKRASNREWSTALLVSKGIAFETKNVGAHLIVRSNSLVIDFWPGTGKWIDRQGPIGRGVKNLLKHINNCVAIPAKLA